MYFYNICYYYNIYLKYILIFLGDFNYLKPVKRFINLSHGILECYLLFWNFDFNYVKYSQKKFY